MVKELLREHVYGESHLLPLEVINPVHMDVDEGTFDVYAEMAQSPPSSQNLAYNAYTIPSSQSSSCNTYADLVPSPEPAFDAYEEAKNSDELQSTLLHQPPPAPEPTTSHGKGVQLLPGPSHDGQIPPAHPSPTVGGFSLFGPPSNNSPLLPLPVGGIFNSPPFIPDTWVNDHMGDFFMFQGLDAGMSPIECQNQLHVSALDVLLYPHKLTPCRQKETLPLAPSPWVPTVWWVPGQDRSTPPSPGMAIQNEFIVTLAQQLQEADFLAQCLDTGLTSMELIRAALLAAKECDWGLATEGS
ncbi:hypothetical protein JAAARDRAFT_201039 [Jaapia argillacea MUCL 33604]|uniref:Uncharacterized protein n=1 Tax=Jaapia argillacea MUCL 33604 TaxID=933084 RepID=A0A067P2V1_9AGAM|nr:hypothetical protein JAAARDRAFT_201039 [Jaapia argillacea MUCL 33604]